MPRIQRIPLVAVTVATGFLLGCDPPRSPAQPAIVFQPKVDGSPETRLAYIQQLAKKFRAVDAPDLMRMRKYIIEFNDAIAATAETVLDDKSSTPEQLRLASELMLNALHARREVEPDESFRRILVACDKIEALRPGTELVPLAAFNRVFNIAEIPAEQFGSDAKKFDMLSEAVLRLGRADPPHEQAAMIVNRTGMEAIEKNRPDRAKALFELLKAKYPSELPAKFADGALHRIELVGKPVDDFQAADVDGKPFDIKSLRGRVVVVLFWATWNEDSKMEMQSVGPFWTDNVGRGLTVVAVNLDQTPEQVKLFRGKMKTDWTHIHTPPPDITKNEVMSPLAMRYGVEEIPYVLVMDREGRLAASGKHFSEMREQVSKLLDQPSPTTKAARKDAKP